jgi:flagellar hook assembly protein FlgD/cell division protein FtsN
MKKLFLLFMIVMTVAFSGNIFAYNHSVMAYGGYHKFEENTGLGNGIEFGAAISEYITPFSFKASVGAVKPKNNSSLIKVYSVLGSYDLFKLRENINLFISLGLSGYAPFSPIRENCKIVYGGGAYMDLAPDICLKGTALFGLDTIGQIGLEKKISLFNRESKNKKKDICKLAPIQTPSNIVIYAYQDKKFVDVQKHWARPQISRVTGYGLINGQQMTVMEQVKDNEVATKEIKSNIDIFLPEDPITKANAVKLVSGALNLLQTLNNEFARIRYEVKGIINQGHFVTISILDDEDNKIKLLKNDECLSGWYTVTWDGTNDNNIKVAPGNYKVQMLINSEKYHKNISVISKTIPTFYTNATDIIFSDIATKNAVKPYINYSYEIGLLNINPDITEFKPENLITKYDFIVLIGKALYYSGANTKITADISKYKDARIIPNNGRKYLDLYISEFGYGGDENNRLDPFKKITRAEATVITYRFINWQKNRLKNGFPFLAKQIEVDNFEFINPLVIKKTPKITKKVVKKKRTVIKTKQKPRKQKPKKAPIKQKIQTQMKPSAPFVAETVNTPAIPEDSSGFVSKLKSRFGFGKKNKESKEDSIKYRNVAGSYKKLIDAKKKVASLKADGIDCDIWKQEKGGKLIYHVQLGNFESRKDALEQMRDLKEEGLKVKVIRV